MPNRYAVASGNWSNTAIWDGGTLPTSADVVRPNGFNVTIDQTITVQELRNDATAPAVAGGTFTLTGNHTVNISIGIQCFASNLLIYNGTGTAFITGTNSGAAIISSTTTNSTATVLHSGTGHLTVDMVINSIISGELSRFNISVTGGGTLTSLKTVRKGLNNTAINAGGTAAIAVSTTAGAVINVPDVVGTGGSAYTITSTSQCTINVNGNITGQQLDASGTPNGGAISMTGTNTVLNITGNVIGPNSASGGGIQRVVFLNAAGTINMNGVVNNLNAAGANGNNTCINLALNNSVLNLIGSVVGGCNSGASIISNGSLNITGSVSGGSFGASPAISVIGGVCTITGNVTGSSVSSSSNISITAGTCNITGTITGGASNGASAVNCTGGTLNHIGTVQASATACGIVGGLPTTSTVTCTGPFLKNNFVVAFAGQMLRINAAYNPYFEFEKSNGVDVTYVDQSTLNFPAINNVRSGITYASGLYTGTLAVPLPAQVLAGIPIDATTGTLLMSPADFWNYLISSGFISGSIGERLQNASTVATTGAQIASYNI